MNHLIKPIRSSHLLSWVLFFNMVTVFSHGSHISTWDTVMSISLNRTTIYSLVLGPCLHSEHTQLFSEFKVPSLKFYIIFKNFHIKEIFIWLVYMIKLRSPLGDTMASTNGIKLKKLDFGVGENWVPISGLHTDYMTLSISFNFSTFLIFHTSFIGLLWGLSNILNIYFFFYSFLYFSYIFLLFSTIFSFFPVLLLFGNNLDQGQQTFS